MNIIYMSTQILNQIITEKNWPGATLGMTSEYTGLNMFHLFGEICLFLQHLKMYNYKGMRRISEKAPPDQYEKAQRG